MARTDNLTNFLTDVADAIRTKTGSTDPIQASSFDTAIENIPSGEAIPTSPSEFNAQVLKYFDYLHNLPNNYNVYTQNNITLYTPNADFKTYVIYKKTDNIFRVGWLKTDALVTLYKNSSNVYNIGYHYYMTSRAIDKTTFDDDNVYSGNSAIYLSENPTTFGRTGPIYWNSNTLNSLQECINAIQNNTTQYSYNASSFFGSVEKLTPYGIAYCNGPIWDSEEKSYVSSQKISSNETIEVIPSS